MASRQSREVEADATRLVTELFPVTETEAEDLPEPGPASNPFELPPPQTVRPSNQTVSPSKATSPLDAPALDLRSSNRFSDVPLQAADLPLRGFSAPPRVPEMRLRPDFSANPPAKTRHRVYRSHSNARWLTVAVVLIWTVAGLIWIGGPLSPIQSSLPSAASSEASRPPADAGGTVATTGVAEARPPDSGSTMNSPAPASTRTDRPVSASATVPAPRSASNPPTAPATRPASAAAPTARVRVAPDVATPAARPAEMPAPARAREPVTAPIDRPLDDPRVSPGAPAINPPTTPAPNTFVEAASPPPLPPPDAPPAVTATSAAAPAATPAPSAETLAPPPPAAAATVASTRALDVQAVERLIGRYRAAYESLDAAAARRVYPKVNSDALSRAFSQLEQQGLSFDRCEIGIYGALAQASCNGTARYVPRTGSKTPRIDRRQWTFRLRKGPDDWAIDSVEVR